MSEDLKARLRDEHLPMTRGEAADHIEALELALTKSRAETAAAYERAAEIAEHFQQVCGRNQDGDYYVGEEAAMFGNSVAQEIIDAIRALATPDQTAALDAVRAEARAQGMREAAVLCADDAEFAHKKRVASETREEAANWAMIVARCDLHESRILAAIKGAKA